MVRRYGDVSSSKKELTVHQAAGLLLKRFPSLWFAGAFDCGAGDMQVEKIIADNNETSINRYAQKVEQIELKSGE